ncbi:MAG TPA: serine hydrolase domain-containing protein [Gemmataceae bacterium]|nr:serine hydrolase domain-containing protein [Gemmataceae bacterium]
MNLYRGIFPLLLFSIPAVLRAEPPLPVAKPGEVGASSERLDRIDAVVKQALDHGDAPGAVVLITHRGHIIFRRAYGLRSKQPAETPMTVDTIFDLASLTKPLATASAILLLVEQGKLRPSDPVSRYLPAFAAKGKDKVTVEQLLLHTSGLIPDNPVSDYQDGRDKAIQRICDLEPASEPGAKFAYSDLNYIILGELVEKISGKPLDEFAKENLFTPLGLTTMGFKPADSLNDRIAPTEKRDGKWLIGDVHDPRSALLGGVAGHAGLFATADELAVCAEMLLDGGVWKDRRILSDLTVKRLTTPHPVPLANGGLGQRTWGWDVDTPYSSNRGELFAPGAGFGHTGFTGTSLWIDHELDVYVVLLTNRVHPTRENQALPQLRPRFHDAVLHALRGARI